MTRSRRRRRGPESLCSATLTRQGTGSSLRNGGSSSGSSVRSPAAARTVAQQLTRQRWTAQPLGSAQAAAVEQQLRLVLALLSRVTDVPRGILNQYEPYKRHL